MLKAWACILPSVINRTASRHVSDGSIFQKMVDLLNSAQRDGDLVSDDGAFQFFDEFVNDLEI